jgi:hypothetical protein
MKSANSATIITSPHRPAGIQSGDSVYVVGKEPGGAKISCRSDADEGHYIAYLVGDFYETVGFWDALGDGRDPQPKHILVGDGDIALDSARRAPLQDPEIVVLHRRVTMQLWIRPLPRPP